MNKAIPIIFLTSWAPFVFALAFPEISDGLYMITGFMWMIFGTWCAILLLRIAETKEVKQVTNVE